MKGNKLAKAETAASTKKRAATKKKTTKAKVKTKKKSTTGQTDAAEKKPAVKAPRKKAAKQTSAEAASKRTTKRVAKKRKHAETPIEEAKPSVTTASPAVSVEQDDETITIRFPAATPPPRRSQRDAEGDESVAEQIAEPEAPIEPATAADDDDLPESPSDTQDTQDTQDIATTDEQAEPKRGKRRRRRRRKKNGRPETEDVAPAAPAEDTPEERAEVESASEAGVDEPPATKKSGRRRRRRRKNGRPAVEAGAQPPESELLEEHSDEADEALESTETDQADDSAERDKPDEEKQPERRRRGRRRGRGGRTSETAQKPPVVSEKLKPTNEKEMIMNVVPNEECRIAIMESGKLQEIYLERASSENHVGNIYKGVVTNVESSIQAAFVDFGLGKNGFLHISDLHPEYFPDGEGQTENVGRKTPRRSRPPIQRCLRRKQELLVQITKEGIGTKGPTLTTYLSIPGRFLVMMPGMRQLGVSRKIEDEEARHKLRDQLAELELPEDMGFIARTAALDHTKRELQSDLNYLSRLWKAVEVRIKENPAPTELYTESDLVIRTIRDVYTSDITRIVIDDYDVAERANEFLSIFSPRSRDAVVHYDGPQPIFHRYNIEKELEGLHSRHVPLKSGGSLVIDQTEALVAVDVNSGKFRTEDDAEATAFKINLEAADEIPRQLRLRDLGGLVICDFIDMRQESHKREIERTLNRNLKEHKERAKILRTSAFGIIEMTRQRQRASLTRSVYQDCRRCNGSGLVKTPESVVLDAMRLIQLAIAKESVHTIEVTVSPEVAHLIQNRKRNQLHELEADGRQISIRSDANIVVDEIRMQCHDQRGRAVSRS